MLKKLKQFDFIIVFILVCFMVLSSMMVYSATLDDRITISLTKSLTIYGICLVAFVATALFDYRVLMKFWPYLYGVGMLLLLYVFFFGKVVNGAKGWIKITESLNLQPAELMKLILILVIGAWLAKRKGESLEFVKDVLPIGLLVFAAFFIVVVMPDMGNAMIYVIILIGMYWIGNIRYSHMFIGVAVIVGIFVLAYYLYNTYHEPITTFMAQNNFGHWVKRIDGFLYEDADKDWSLQARRALVAIGSGGLAGQGFLQGQATHSGGIIYGYSDTIFAVIGEELGFRGGAILLLMYFVLIYRMILISIRSIYLSGSYIIIGIVSMFVLQIFQNIGMLIDILPLTGITLPFISYGGTSLFINMVSMGLVMSVKLHQDKYFDFEDD
ncbi:FtsW/RodA/SpoVE family cell cycle protein [Paenibacillus sp. N1-5-1-14]|uniref:FtsW/RodA/SpoVE family cell cycle protein n=1 Tax=Paenibacillus radicibacter TaxID=2972488 RepID=UPI00215937E6|nr:FtsW/RodA/SpoVE family cell cycle protein [Paenibacillus radicibacter]MCR8644140.1 FtsW/RodA/SpoVE family cell cycle protein [Paenibacillus radicibacter]